MIRHAAPAAFPVVPLPVAVIEPPLLALLVPPVGVPPLLPLCFLPASLAAIPVAPVTMATDPEHRATANTRANPPAQELLAGPHPRPCSGTGRPRAVMATSIPSTDDAGPFFRAGTKKPDRRLTAGVFPFRLRPYPARSSASFTGGEESTSLYRRSPKKRGSEACFPSSLFSLCGAERGPLLSDGHERMRAMARKRNGLIPAGKTSGSLDRPVKAIRDASPQALHHFTQADQVNQLVSANEADPDLGFMARLMALCSLPRTNPGNRKEYKRVNGPYTLYMNAVGGNKLPFGNLPRLLLAWVCTEAVRTQSRELILGASLSEFMRKLDVLSSDSGGTWGIRTRLRNQMDRLFSSTISLIYEDARARAKIISPVASRTEFWWDPRRPDERMLWKSKIRLGEDFFNEIIRHPIPIDMNTLKALKRSSLGLDLYLWVAYRTFTLNRPLRLSWRQVYLQFGSDQAQAGDKNIVNDFRTKCLRELKKIKLAWPDLKYATATGVLILSPSKPSIPRLQLVE